MRKGSVTRVAMNMHGGTHLRCDRSRALFGRVLHPESFVHFYSEKSGLYLCGSHKLQHKGKSHYSLPSLKLKTSAANTSSLSWGPNSFFLPIFLVSSCRAPCNRLTNFLNSFLCIQSTSSS